MADDFRMALEALLRDAEVQDPNFLREGVPVLAQELMELQVNQHIGGRSAVRIRWSDYTASWAGAWTSWGSSPMRRP